MMTVKKVSELTGVSVRTLQYYDKIGLLPSSGHTESGYRLYDEDALDKLQQIMMFRELEFPLKEIKSIMTSPGYDSKTALAKQIELLELKKQHIENLITFARGIKMFGVKAVDFSKYDRSKLDEYAKKAKEQWGHTKEYAEMQEKEKNRTEAETEQLTEKLMQIFVEFGEMKHQLPESEEVQAQVKKLQDFITENCYTCSDKILAGLGKAYAGGGEMSDNINDAGGIGTADFAARAIEIYVNK